MIHGSRFMFSEVKHENYCGIANLNRKGKVFFFPFLFSIISGNSKSRHQ